jgi:hypothetical protein
MDWVLMTADDLRFIVNAVYAAEQLQAPIPVGLKLKCLQHVLTIQQRGDESCEQEPSISGADVVNRSL